MCMCKLLDLEHELKFLASGVHSRCEPVGVGCKDDPNFHAYVQTHDQPADLSCNSHAVVACICLYGKACTRSGL